MYVLPTDIWIVQGVKFAFQNARDGDSDGHGEIKKCVQASNNHESGVFAVRNIPTARQELVHLFSMSQECTKRQSWVIKSSQIAGIVTMRGLTSKNDTPQAGYELWTVDEYITHIAVNIEDASGFFVNFKPRWLYNYAYFRELII